MGHDPYEVLGVPRNSGPEAWKKAYRRLAMRWHPDRNPDPHATERFKQINAAYEQLLAVDLPETPKTSASEESPEPEPAPARKRAADIRHSLELDLEEAATGCRQTVHYTRSKPCPTCAGSGEAGIAKTRFCDACHGSGRIRDAERVLVACPACGGRGIFTERTCRDCHGSGHEIAEISLEITVPPGMLPGDELRLAGQGEPGNDELAPGDLYLTIILRTHRLFELRGRDLHCRMPVSALAMLAGAGVEVPLLNGVLVCPLEPGAAEVRTLRLAGRGYPGRGKAAAGDLVAELLPHFPSRLNPRQRKALLQAHVALQDDVDTALPEIAAWWRDNGYS